MYTNCYIERGDVCVFVSIRAGGDCERTDYSAPALVPYELKTYKLSQFKDKQAVVVAWFPKAFTGG